MRLKPDHFDILAAAEAAPVRCYASITRSFGNGRFDVSGRTLAAMTDAGLLTPMFGDTRATRGARAWRLTEAGRAALAARRAKA